MHPWGSERRWERRCEQLVNQLGQDAFASIDDLVGAVATMRGRRLSIVPYPLDTPGMPCGVWVALPDVDVMFIEDRTSVLHREHICLHELAHVLCDHRGASGGVGEKITDRLLPDLSPDAIDRVLARASYDTEEEREAEHIATFFGARLRNAGAARASEATTDRVATQLAKAIGLSER